MKPQRVTITFTDKPQGGFKASIKCYPEIKKDAVSSPCLNAAARIWTLISMEGEERLGAPFYDKVNRLTSGNAAAQDRSDVKGFEADTKRLDELGKLIRNCPHTEITFSDDPDNEEGACGFMIRVEGCELLEVCAFTFREVIDKLAIATAPPLEPAAQPSFLEDKH